MYASRISYFDESEEGRSGLVLEALLAYWLSWFIIPSGPGDGLSGYVLPLVILLEKGEKLTLAPLYLGSL